jgi:predicted cupin superfamily sugar epimerase
MTLTAQQVMDTLGLKPHPTCGFVAETYRSSRQVPQSALPAGFDGARPLGSVLYFMVTPTAQIRLHRIRNDQMYHHYLGDPLEVLLLYSNGSGEIKMVGDDLAAGMRPQLFIPGGTFHISRLPVTSAFALLGTSEWPGVDPPDVEIGDPAKLMAAYPAWSSQIAAFVQHAADALAAAGAPRQAT